MQRVALRRCYAASTLAARPTPGHGLTDAKRFEARAWRCWGESTNSGRMTSIVHPSPEPQEHSPCASHCNGPCAAMMAIGACVVLVWWRENGLARDTARAYPVITLTNQRFMIPSYITVSIYAGNDRRCGQGSMLQRRWAWNKGQQLCITPPTSTTKVRQSNRADLEPLQRSSTGVLPARRR